MFRHTWLEKDQLQLHSLCRKGGHVSLLTNGFCGAVLAGNTATKDKGVEQCLQASHRPPSPPSPDDTASSDTTSLVFVAETQNGIIFSWPLDASIFSIQFIALDKPQIRSHEQQVGRSVLRMCVCRAENTDRQRRSVFLVSSQSFACCCCLSVLFVGTHTAAGCLSRLQSCLLCHRGDEERIPLNVLL